MHLAEDGWGGVQDDWAVGDGHAVSVGNLDLVWAVFDGEVRLLRSLDHLSIGCPEQKTWDL